MKIAIITGLCGDRDRISNPTVIHEGVDYISFSDKPWPNTIWRQNNIIDFTFDSTYKNRRNAKIYKIMPMIMAPGYDYYFWVDATHDVIEHPIHIIQKYLNHSDIAVFKHRERNCVYDEIEELKKLEYDYKEVLTKQSEIFRNVDFPVNYGLYELPVIAWRNTRQSQKLALRWWEFICGHSSRDQISLPFILWSLSMRPAILPGRVNGGLWNNNIMTQTRHHGL